MREPLNNDKELTHGNVFTFFENVRMGIAKSILESIEYYRIHGHFKQPTEDEILRSRLKFAKVGGEVKFADNQTGQVYATGGYETGYKLIEPLTPIEGTVDRWCTGFDL